jgi:2-polyprenyl-3-methyl-5-hydroxy-6-metoxy-1,4-benzoquinol methylase
MGNTKEHWETVFTTKKENEVSWYQSKPETSINFFIKNEIPKDANIIDIGGGDSHLIDNLLDLGYTNLYLLDISEKAIERIKNRLGVKANNVTFIVSNILDFQSNLMFDVWHDRASFHFQTNPEAILRYKKQVSKYINENSHLFIGTFSEQGPKKCSGLDITQYNPDSLQTVFNPEFELVSSFTEDHPTPFDTTQNFIFTHFKKK